MILLAPHMIIQMVYALWITIDTQLAGVGCHGTGPLLLDIRIAMDTETAIMVVDRMALDHMAADHMADIAIKLT